MSYPPYDHCTCYTRLIIVRVCTRYIARSVTHDLIYVRVFTHDLIFVRVDTHDLIFVTASEKKLTTTGMLNLSVVNKK